MAVVEGTNSFVSVADADAYFEGRVSSDVWATSLLAAKEKTLISATRILDSLEWAGVAVSDSQALSFPRSGLYYEPRVGYDKEIGGTPNRIKDATFEFAYHLLINPDVVNDSGFVRNISIDSVKLDSIVQPSAMPSIVMDTIKPLLLRRVGRTWWRAN